MEERGQSAEILTENDILFGNPSHSDDKIKEEIAEDEDPNKWNCKQCTFLNEIENWTDIKQSICQMCDGPDDTIKQTILAAIQAKGAQVVQKVETE